MLVKPRGHTCDAELLRINLLAYKTNFKLLPQVSPSSYSILHTLIKHRSYTWTCLIVVGLRNRLLQ